MLFRTINVATSPAISQQAHISMVWAHFRTVRSVVGRGAWQLRHGLDPSSNAGGPRSNLFFWQAASRNIRGPLRNVPTHHASEDAHLTPCEACAAARLPKEVPGFGIALGQVSLTSRLCHTISKLTRSCPWRLGEKWTARRREDQLPTHIPMSPMFSHRPWRCSVLVRVARPVAQLPRHWRRFFRSASFSGNFSGSFLCLKDSVAVAWAAALRQSKEQLGTTAERLALLHMLHMFFSCLSPKRQGRNSNFLWLGGDSLAALRACRALREALNLPPGYVSHGLGQSRTWSCEWRRQRGVWRGE